MPVASVAVVDDAAQLASVPDSVGVLLERTRQHRGLPLQVMVVLRADDLVRRFGGFEGARDVGRSLAATLGATVLFAEGPLAPSEWVRVRPTGDLDLVSLDTDETGDVASFFVVAERAFSGDGPAADAGPAPVSA